MTEFRQAALRAYRAMCMARAFDTKLSALYRAGKVFGGVFLGRGHEAIAAASAVFLQKGKDVYNPFIREMAGRCVWDDDALREAARCYFGSMQGCMAAKDGNVHWGRPAEGTPAPISHLGAMVAVVAGMMMAKRMQRQEGCVGMACIGDGATSVGAAHEACNLIAVEKLPIVVLVTNNQYAYSTPNEQEFACKSLSARGAGYGMATHECDGTDLFASLRTLRDAVHHARCGDGPQWVTAETLRLCGHGEHDDAAYIPRALKDAYADRDPMDVARRQLDEQGWINDEEDTQLKTAAREAVQLAVAQAQQEAAAVVPGTEPEWIATSWRPEKV